MKCHPAAEVFPLMGEKELAELAEDIKQHGLRVPIVRMEYEHDWVLLDGRNRLAACKLAGVAPVYRGQLGARASNEAGNYPSPRRDRSERRPLFAEEDDREETEVAGKRPRVAALRRDELQLGCRRAGATGGQQPMDTHVPGAARCSWQCVGRVGGRERGTGTRQAGG